MMKSSLVGLLVKKQTCKIKTVTARIDPPLFLGLCTPRQVLDDPMMSRASGDAPSEIYSHEEFYCCFVSEKAQCRKCSEVSVVQAICRLPKSMMDLHGSSGLQKLCRILNFESRVLSPLVDRLTAEVELWGFAQRPFVLMENGNNCAIPN